MFGKTENNCLLEIFCSVKYKSKSQKIYSRHSYGTQVPLELDNLVQVYIIGKQLDLDPPSGPANICKDTLRVMFCVSCFVTSCLSDVCALSSHNSGEQ
jgi:hypothetical protein